MILLCLLPISYDYFVDTSVYGQDNLSSEDVKTFSKSMELKKQVSKNYNNDHVESLIVQGRTNNKGSGNEDRSIKIKI